MTVRPIVRALAAGILLAGCGDAPDARVETAATPSTARTAPAAAPTGDGAMPSDPTAFVEAVKAGRLPPIADWPRWDGKVEAPPFGVEPPWDAGNPVPDGKDWKTPQDGGTLIIQYNGAPKTVNHILDNDAVVKFINYLTHPYLVWQDPVRFTYGKPSAEDPLRIFDSADPDDLASRFVKEETLLRADGTRHFGAVSEEAGNWVVRPVARVEGEERKEVRVPKAEGDRVLPGTVVTVFLKPGLKWHDGAPFTAKDVEFSVKVILNEFVNSESLKPYFEVVESCTALGDSVVRWILRRPYFLADDSTVGVTLDLVPLHAYRAAFEKKHPGVPFDPSGQPFGAFFNTCTELNERPLGTGPYRVEAFEMGQRVVLARNPGYHGPRPHADRIIWRFIDDSVAILQALRSGEVDFAAHGPTAEQFGTDMKAPAFREKFVPLSWYTPSMSFVAYNRRVPQLADPRVRAALTLLLDRPGFRAAKHFGCSVLLSGDQYVSGRAYDAAVAPIAYDPEAAKELLDEAGWRDRDGDGVRDREGRKLEFEILITSGNRPLEELVALWLESLKKAGVAPKVSQMEWAAFVKRFEDKKFDTISMGWSMDPESDPHQLWHSKWADPSKPSSNTTSFADPRADALIEAIQSCLDPDERRRYQHALHRMLDADQPYAHLWCRSEIGAYHRKWRGVRLYPRAPGFDLTEWWCPEEFQR